jgi:signal transduction histidine kinase/CheY-like chemotaxis protein
MDTPKILEEIKLLKAENSRLSRELRINKDFLEKVSRIVDAKETLGKALSTANATQKSYMDIILESCPNIILLMDDTGKLVLCTRLFLTLTKTPNFDYIKNQSWREIFGPYLTNQETEELSHTIKTVIKQQKPITFSKWLDLDKSGTNRFYSIELMCIGDAMGAGAGIKAGVLAVFIDITDFMKEKQRAEAANNAKSDFLAVMSHEIRTPMNAILGLNEILSRTELNQTQSKYLEDIKKSAQSLLTIINDILDFSKIEAGKLEIVNSNYNLRTLLDNLYAIFTILYKAKNLKLNFSIDPNIPAAVFGDENRLRQILNNLFSNAMKYTHKGQVDFSAYLSDDGRLYFDIKDTGIGIRQEDTEKLFKPFEQFDTRRNRNVAGTGLGLAICYRLCLLMGGSLSLQSEYGKGSTFTVALPCIPADSLEEEKTAMDEKEFSAPSAKVLVVDDISINLEVCTAMLEAFAIKADTALSGRAAIELVSKNNYDIIFMDHMMPEMDGIEATAKIRALGGHNKTVPIITLTANVLNGAEQMFLDNQFSGFLAKPIEFALLTRCLRQWLPPEKISG